MLLGLLAIDALLLVLHWKTRGTLKGLWIAAGSLPLLFLAYVCVLDIRYPSPTGTETYQEFSETASAFPMMTFLSWATGFVFPGNSTRAGTWGLALASFVLAIVAGVCLVLRVSLPT